MKWQGSQESGIDRRMVMAGGLALASAAYPRMASGAASFPIRPLTLLAPGSPGGGYDQVARLMQSVIVRERLTPVPVEVLNRGGAGGTIGLAELISRHRGDPYTVGVCGAYLVATAIANASPVSLSDSVPIARMMSDYLVVGVPASSPFRHIDDLLNAFAKNPEGMSWCGGSAGGTDHMLVGMMAEAAGVSPLRIRYVAYAGGGEASAALLGGQVSAGVNGYSEWRGLRDDNRIRFLASSSPTRIDPITPTFREQGHDITLENWRGVFAAPGLSDEEMGWWKGLLRKIRASGTWKEYAKRNVWDDTYLEGPELTTFLALEEQRVGRILARLGIGSADNTNAVVGPWAFPTAIGAAAAAASVGVLLEKRPKAIEAQTPQPPDTPLTAIAPEGAAAAEVAAAEPASPGASLSWKRFVAGLGVAAVYLGVMQVVGFLIATPVFLIAVCWLIGTRSLLRDALICVAVSTTIWALFTQLLQVILP